MRWVLVLVLFPESLGARSKQAGTPGATKREKTPATVNAQH